MEYYFKLTSRKAAQEQWDLQPKDLTEILSRHCDCCKARLWIYCIDPHNWSQIDEAYRILEETGDDTAPYALVCENCYTEKFASYPSEE